MWVYAVSTGLRVCGEGEKNADCRLSNVDCRMSNDERRMRIDEWMERQNKLKSLKQQDQKRGAFHLASTTKKKKNKIMPIVVLNHPLMQHSQIMYTKR